MSRIILSRYDDGQECVVVGWDHPGGGCWWQEFNKEKDEKGRPIWEYDDSWMEVKGYGGYGKGIPWTRFRSEVPEHIRPLVTDEVLKLIDEHSDDPNSGRIPPVDMTKK